MSFNSLIFILLFLPLTLGIYYLAKDKLRNLILLMASIVFFIWTGIDTISILILVALGNYLLAYIMQKAKNKTIILSIAIISNTLVLVYYKYSNFFLNIISKFTSSEVTTLKILIPLGISYITFQQISYIIDIFRNKVTFNKNFLEYLLYVLFFPKIIAGPITNYKDFEPQLRERNFSKILFENGIQRFSIGLGKKVIIASTLQTFVDEVFLINPENIRTPIVWIAMLAYTLQIYFDFSGYTDMAIGIANMFSFKLPENFNRPYIANSITDFWKRWHISLTTFLREYIYFPLGGSKKGYIRTLINIFIIFFISGFWHGAAFTFIIWGCYHGILMILEKIGLYKFLNKLPKFLGLIYTFMLVNIGWVFFRAEGLTYSITFLKRLLSLGGSSFVDLSQFSLSLKFFIILIISLIIVFFPQRKLLKETYATIIIKTTSILILIYSISIIASGSFKPFIYFNF